MSTMALWFANPFSLTEINFEDALAEAERLDKHMKETGKVVGPLHGIPFSVKV
jgi:amidase